MGKILIIQKGKKWIKIQCKSIIGTVWEINELPKQCFDTVSEIDLSRHRITGKIPRNIWKFTHLEKLVLNNNNFTVLPKNIGDLTELEYIDVRANNLKNISSAIGKLTNLSYLDLASNKLEKIPSTITNLHNLNIFSLDRNPLKYLSPSLCKFMGEKTNNIFIDVDWKKYCKKID